MTSLKMKLCAALLPMVLVGCASPGVVVPVSATCPVPPAPPAWTMADPSNSLQLLDDLGALGLPMTERRGLQRLVAGTGQLEELFGLLLKGGARHRAVGLEELVIGSDRRFGRHDPLPQRRALFG